jgi:hypothetical protein
MAGRIGIFNSAFFSFGFAKSICKIEVWRLYSLLFAKLIRKMSCSKHLVCYPAQCLIGTGTCLGGMTSKHEARTVFDE